MRPIGDKMKKQIIALIAAILTTIVMGFAMFAIGGAALFNKNTADASNAKTQANVALTSEQQAAQIEQLQELVRQYQDRETQYQSQLDQASLQIQSLNDQLQRTEQILIALQQVGLISITEDGRVIINR